MTVKSRQALDFYLGNVLVALIYIPVRLAAIILRRNHSPAPRGNIAFIKLLGGGSVFLALPAIMAIRDRHPGIKISLVCTRAIAGFARAYGVFDHLVIIDDRSLVSLVKSTMSAIWWMFKNIDTTVDLEVHSRLTTVLTTASCVRNRVGLVDHTSLWRRRLYTHAIYVNPFGKIFEAYDSIAHLLDVQEISLSRALAEFRNRVSCTVLPDTVVLQNTEMISVGIGCSDLFSERQVSVSGWKALLTEVLRLAPHAQIAFLGAQADSDFASRIIKEARLGDRALNLCGRLSLEQSLAVLAKSSGYLGIDSALIHFARFLTPVVVGYWGPTIAETRLRSLDVREKHYSLRVSCSPCVHLTPAPPCMGQNRCMDFAREYTDGARFIIDGIRELGAKTTSAVEAQGIGWVFFPDEVKARQFDVRSI
jgi:ADP-heptose:LPS heptosyltransferase